MFHARCLRESFQLNVEESKQSCPICDKLIVTSKVDDGMDSKGTMESSQNIGISINDVRQSHEQINLRNMPQESNDLEPYIANEQNVDNRYVDTDEGEPEPDKDADITGENL